MKAFTKLITLIAAASLLAGAQAFAADTDESSTSTVKAKDVTPKDKAKANDIDNEITNARMRADLGSKSKYSLSTSLGYAGGSIATPLSNERPNLSGQPIVPKVSMSGTFSARYRVNKRSSVSFGTGLSVKEPFSNPDANLSNPRVGYNYATKVAGAQMVHSVTAVASTDSAGRLTCMDKATSKPCRRATPKADKTEVDDNSVGRIGYQNTLLKQVNKSGFQMGVYTYADYTAYSGATSSGYDVSSGQYGYSLGVIPFMEYQINDKYSLRTVFNQFNYVHINSSKDWNDFARYGQQQSVGLGISVSRDVYLYPNFQFRTEDLTMGFWKNRFAKESTVGLSASINMF